MLDVNAVNAARKAVEAKKSKNGVRVTENVLRRASEQAHQACISVRMGNPEYRGLVSVGLGGHTYQICKNDTHAAWATKQGARVGDFVALFNVLAENPNKLQGTVVAADLAGPDGMYATPQDAIDAAK